MSSFANVGNAGTDEGNATLSLSLSLSSDVSSLKRLGKHAVETSAHFGSASTRIGARSCHCASHIASTASSAGRRVHGAELLRARAPRSAHFAFGVTPMTL